MHVIRNPGVAGIRGNTAEDTKSILDLVETRAKTLNPSLKTEKQDIEPLYRPPETNSLEAPLFPRFLYKAKTLLNLVHI